LKIIVVVVPYLSGLSTIIELDTIVAELFYHGDFLVESLFTQFLAVSRIMLKIVTWSMTHHTNLFGG